MVVKFALLHCFSFNSIRYVLNWTPGTRREKVDRFLKLFSDGASISYGIIFCGSYIINIILTRTVCVCRQALNFVLCIYRQCSKVIYCNSISMLLFQYILNAVVKDFGTSPIGASK